MTAFELITHYLYNNKHAFEVLNDIYFVKLDLDVDKTINVSNISILVPNKNEELVLIIYLNNPAIGTFITNKELIINELSEAIK